MIVGLYGVSLCLLMPSVLCIGGFGELGELGYIASGRQSAKIVGDVRSRMFNRAQSMIQLSSLSTHNTRPFCLYSYTEITSTRDFGCMV